PVCPSGLSCLPDKWLKPYRILNPAYPVTHRIAYSVCPERPESSGLSILSIRRKKLLYKSPIEPSTNCHESRSICI
ncbi:MAG: hypothetical protein MUC48_22150, partial [Leptolyngbya sp. Prado105]|nr:hypothetical protein [Leptolyngbya sp. Prado105]